MGLPARALFALFAVSGCRYRPTQITLFLDTNVSSAREASLSIAVLDGERSIDEVRARRATTAPQVPTRSGLPGSVTLVPREGSARSGAITLLATLSVRAGAGQPAIEIERFQRLRWIERNPQQSRLYFNARCSDRAADCTSVAAAECTVSRRCIEQGATCGDNGECVSIELPTVIVAPETALDANVADVSAPPVDASIARSDAGGCDRSLLDPSTVNTVSAGSYHACAIRGGALFCWGLNSSGQLGTGDLVARNAPAPIAPSQRWIDVAAGESATCALDEFGRAWCWGRNDLGQLGAGDSMNRASPTMIAGTCGLRDIDGRHNTLCAVSEGGALFCWGDNAEGQLSSEAGAIPFASSPMQLGAQSRWLSASASQGHTCAIRDPGALFCWGRNSQSELGLGPSMPAQVRAPSQVGSALDWRQIDTGQNSSCGVRADGSAYCWGENDGFSAVFSSPTRMSGVAGATMAETDTFHWCLLDATGALSCSGRNTEGQLADATNTDRTTLAATTPATTFARIAVGRFFSCAITAAGVPYCAGENADGQLGTGDNGRRTSFTPTR